MDDLPRQRPAHRQHRRQGRPGGARRSSGFTSRRTTSSPRRCPTTTAVRFRPRAVQRRRPCTASTPIRKPRSASLWTKTTPYLKLPTVSSPACLTAQLIFGDGMHQTDGAILHCLRLDKGLPLWQLSGARQPGPPGRLADHRRRQGLSRRRRGRRPVRGPRTGSRSTARRWTPPAIQKILDENWAEAAGEVRGRQEEGPRFRRAAQRGSAAQARTRPAWQQGKDKWHVDAPVAVAGDHVLVASAFLDKEKVGDRASSASTPRPATSSGGRR